MTIALTLGVILPACGGGDDSTEPSTSVITSVTTSTVAAVTTKPSPEPPTLVPSSEVGRVELIDPQPPPADVEEATQQAIDDLVSRAAVASDQIDVTVAEELTWNDGSLGCPEPGRAYTQSLVPGLRVILTVDDRDYAYHAAESRALFYCPSPSDSQSVDI